MATLQFSCLGKPTDRGAWGCSPWGRQEMDTAEHTCTYSLHLVAPAFILSKIKENSRATRPSAFFWIPRGPSS